MQLYCSRYLNNAYRRPLSVASFVLNFSPVPFTFESNLVTGAVGYFMYFRLVYLPEFFASTSGKNWTSKLFHQATELMVTIDHEFFGNCTSPPLAFLSFPFHMSMLLPSQKRLTRVFRGAYG